MDCICSKKVQVPEASKLVNRRLARLAMDGRGLRQLPSLQWRFVMNDRECHHMPHYIVYMNYILFVFALCVLRFFLVCACVCLLFAWFLSGFDAFPLFLHYFSV